MEYRSNDYFSLPVDSCLRFSSTPTLQPSNSIVRHRFIFLTFSFDGLDLIHILDPIVAVVIFGHDAQGKPVSLR